MALLLELKVKFKQKSTKNNLLQQTVKAIKIKIFKKSKIKIKVIQ
jgi:hypothetical protein